MKVAWVREVMDPYCSLGQEQDTEQSCVFTDDVILLYALSGAIVSQWVEI